MAKALSHRLGGLVAPLHHRLRAPGAVTRDQWSHGHDGVMTGRCDGIELTGCTMAVLWEPAAKNSELHFRRVLHLVQRLRPRRIAFPLVTAPP